MRQPPPEDGPPEMEGTRTPVVGEPRRVAYAPRTWVVRVFAGTVFFLGLVGGALMDSWIYVAPGGLRWVDLSAFDVPLLAAIVAIVVVLTCVVTRG